MRPAQTQPRPDPAAARDRAGHHFDQGEDCIEAIILAFGELGLLEDTAREALAAAVRGLGNGMGTGAGPCGALTGALLIIGTVLGGKTKKGKGKYRYSRAFTRQFEKRFGAIVCRDLRPKSPLSCRETTCETAAMLVEYLASAPRPCQSA